MKGRIGTAGFSFCVVAIAAILCIATTPQTAFADKGAELGETLSKISKLTWGIQDLKKQGLNDSHKDVAAKVSALKKQKAKFKKMLGSGIKPDSARVPDTGEPLLKYCKRRKMTPDIVALLKKHGATK